MLCSECSTVAAAHHNTIRLHQLADKCSWMAARKVAQVDSSFGVTTSHKHPTVPSDQRQYVARAVKVSWGSVGSREQSCGESPVVS